MKLTSQQQLLSLKTITGISAILVCNCLRKLPLLFKPFPYLIHNQIQSKINKLIWRHHSGICSVKSAYLLSQRLSTNDVLGQSESWTWIWKLKIPPKIILFIWKCAHNKIPTRSIIFAFSTLTQQSCPRCNDLESPIHIQWDCFFATQIWLTFPHIALKNNFFDTPIYTWCKMNCTATATTTTNYLPWNTVFAFTLWSI